MHYTYNSSVIQLKLYRGPNQISTITINDLVTLLDVLGPTLDTNHLDKNWTYMQILSVHTTMLQVLLSAVNLGREGYTCRLDCLYIPLAIELDIS